jgi:hypothetical protein
VPLSFKLVKIARKAMIAKVGKIPLCELKLSWILGQQLIHTVEEENKQRREVLES